MENEKKVVNLAKEQLEQVAGGNGTEDYLGCHCYLDLFLAKDSNPEDIFRLILNDYLYDREKCGIEGRLSRIFDCQHCPVRTEWQIEYPL